MALFFVLKVTCEFRENAPVTFTKHTFAGPFDTEQEAQLMAHAQNAARRGGRNSASFLVGMESDIEAGKIMV